eukprot:2800779-Rhodomonas_salina.2
MRARARTDRDCLVTEATSKCAHIRTSSHPLLYFLAQAHATMHASPHTSDRTCTFCALTLDGNGIGLKAVAGSYLNPAPMSSGCPFSYSSTVGECGMGCADSGLRGGD